MNDYAAVSAYQQSAARGASPVGLIIALYDTILRDFRRALTALDSSNVEARVFERNHALTVIAHLRDVLDHQQGGPAAAQLSRFYDLTHTMIMEANVSGSRATLLKLVDMYSGLRQAWEQTERQVSATTAAQADSGHAPSLEPATAKSSLPLPPSIELSTEPAPAAPSARWSA